MSNRADRPETGEVQRSNEDREHRGEPAISYNPNRRYDDRFGAHVDTGDHPPGEDKALHDAMARNIGTRRDAPEEKLPSDPLDEAYSDKAPRRPS